MEGGHPGPDGIEFCDRTGHCRGCIHRGRRGNAGGGQVTDFREGRGALRAQPARNVSVHRSPSASTRSLSRSSEAAKKSGRGKKPPKNFFTARQYGHTSNVEDQIVPQIGALRTQPSSLLWQVSGTVASDPVPIRRGQQENRRERISHQAIARRRGQANKPTFGGARSGPMAVSAEYVTSPCFGQLDPRCEEESHGYRRPATRADCHTSRQRSPGKHGGTRRRSRWQASG